VTLTINDSFEPDPDDLKVSGDPKAPWDDPPSHAVRGGGRVMKENSAGRPCPDWCITDHQAPGKGHNTCRRDVAPIPIRSGSPLGIRAYPYRPASCDEAKVIAGGIFGMVIAASADDAKNLAALVEGLSEMTPARIRRFAAQIRHAETLAFPRTQPEPTPETGQ
jgi:hypothetical protein